MREAGGLRHVHLLEPAPLGHGPLWLGYLLEALLPCVEQVTVTCPDLEDYRGLTAPQPQGAGRLALRFLPRARGRDGWQRMLEGAAGLGADLTVITYLDMLMKRPLSADPRRLAGSAVRGLWFCPAPRLRLSRFSPRRLLSRRYRSRYREQQLLRHVPDWLSGAWISDPLLVERVTPRPGLALDVLPDPWPERPMPARDEARRRLGLPGDKVIFLHLGVHDERKGLADAIAAWERLGHLPGALLVRAGIMAPGQAAAMAPLVREGRAILREGRIPEQEMDAWLRACDWLLMPYRYHEGSSGLLAGAAAARRPVLAADYGVVGERVRRAGLGLLFPHLSIAGLAQTVAEACGQDIAGWEPALARYSGTHRLADFIAAVRGPLGLEPAP